MSLLGEILVVIIPGHQQIKGVTIREAQPRSDYFKEDKATGKQKVVDTKEAPKVANPYAWLTPAKCFK